MPLEDCIAEAQAFLSDPPINESTTCDWVIRPLLLCIGYAPRDIESRVADATGQFPDYTILPAEPAYTWYLEAKDWNVNLEDIHAKQALNYANHNGRRFVVLTNGREWRLYDNSIQGIIGEKLKVSALLKQTEAITIFLKMISKAEVIEGGLGRFDLETSERLQQLRIELAVDVADTPPATADLPPVSNGKSLNSSTGNPGVADVKDYIISNIVAPARQRGDKTIIIIARDIHRELKMRSAFPTVCNALDSQDLHRRAGIKLMERTGPRLSSTVTWRFELL